MPCLHVTPTQQNILFESWFAEHVNVLHHVANGFADGADRHDLMQELMLAVWRSIPAFRGGAQVSTYIYRVAHNAALTWRRSARNYRDRVDRFETLAVEPPSASRATAAAEAGAREREALEHVYAAIRQLPPVDRSLILLHLDGVGYAEIAAIHSLTESNVGARLTRLKQRLAAALAHISHELR